MRIPDYELILKVLDEALDTAKAQTLAGKMTPETFQEVKKEVLKIIDKAVMKVNTEIEFNFKGEADDR